MSLPDPEIVAMQTAWLESYRASRRFIIVDDLEGYSVHEHSIDGVAPSSLYATKEEAAARLLQLLGIKTPVTPQNWPERVKIQIVTSPPPDPEAP